MQSETEWCNNWNLIVDGFEKLKDKEETEVQTFWEKSFGQIFGYRSMMGELKPQDPTIVGSNVRLKIDISLYANNEYLAVVELKKESHCEISDRDANQLFSYVIQKHANIGVFICNRIRIYWYNHAKKNEDQDDYIDIEFTKDNPDGAEFVRVFQRSAFQEENVHKFIEGVIERKAKIQEIKGIISKDGFIKDSLTDRLLRSYDAKHIEEALKDLRITVSFDKPVPSAETVPYDKPRKSKNGGEKHPRSLPHWDWLIEQGIIVPEDKITVRKHEDVIAIVVDAENVRYRGQLMSYRSFAALIWYGDPEKAINPYKYLKPFDGGQYYSELRDERMKKLGL